MSRSVFTTAYSQFLRSLIEARSAAGMRQIDLAKRIGKPQSFVSKMETGERRLDLVEFLVVARALAVDPVSMVANLAEALPPDTDI